MQKFCQLNSYLSKTNKMSKEQNEYKAMLIINQTTEHIFKNYVKMTYHKITPHERLKQKLKCVNVIKKKYVVRQQDKKFQ